jgi:hypothetical protein
MSPETAGVCRAAGRVWIPPGEGASSATLLLLGFKRTSLVFGWSADEDYLRY